LSTNDKNIDERLFKILRDTFQTNEINPEDSMDQIPEWDSLRHIQLIIAIEDEFNISIDFADTLEMTSIPEIKKKIQRYLC
jgi:acyl carrier protein